MVRLQNRSQFTSSLRRVLRKPIGLAFAFTLLVISPLLPSISNARWATQESAPIHIRRHDIVVTVNADATWKLRGTLEMKINTAQGRLVMAAYKFPLGDEFENLKIVSAEALEPTVTRAIAPNMIVLRDLEGSPQRLSAPFHVQRAYTIPFGDMSIGTVTRIAYEIDLRKPRIPGLFSMDFTWGQDYPELAGSVTFESKELLYLDVSKAARGLLNLTKGRLAGGINVWKAELRSPVYVKPDQEQGGLLSTASVPRIQISNQASWTPLLDALVPRYNALASEPLPPELQAIVESTRALAKTEDKFNRVIDMVNQLLSYRQDWLSANGGYVPQKLSELMLSKRGDCKDFAFATVMILRALGYTADVALVWRQSPAEKLWIDEMPVTPSLGLFNHAIVRVNEEGRLRYFDPTNKIPFGEGFLSDVGGSWALALTNSASPFARVPSDAPVQSKVKVTQSLDLRPDASVVGSGNVHVEGPLAAELKFVYHQQGAAQIEPYLRSLFGLALKGESASPMIRVNTQDLRGNSFDLSFSYLAPTALQTNGSYREFDLPTPGLNSLPLLSAKDRATDVILSRNLTVEVETKVVGGDLSDETNTSCLALTTFASLLRETKVQPGSFIVNDFVQFRSDRIPAANMRTTIFQSEMSQYSSCLSHVRASIGPRPAFEKSPLGLNPTEVAILKKPIQSVTLADIKVLDEITTPQLNALLSTKIWLATRDLLRRNERSPQVTLEYALALLETGHLTTDGVDVYLPEHVSEAAKLFSTVAASEAKTAKYQRIHASMLYATNRPKEALVALQNAMALEPSQARDATLAAKIYARVGDTAKTEEWLKQATVQKGTKSTRLNAIQNLAAFRLSQNKVNDFIALYKQAINEMPANAWVYHDFAKQLQNIKMWDLSLEQSRKALSIMRFPEAEATYATTLIRKAEGFYYTAPGIATIDPRAMDAAEKLALECLKYNRNDALAYRIAGHAAFLKAMAGDYGSLIATQSYFSKAIDLGAGDAWLNERFNAANIALDSSRGLAQVWTTLNASKRLPAAKTGTTTAPATPLAPRLPGR